MTEWLKIIYDIMAGLGFLVVFIITVAFTWGIFLSIGSGRAKKKQAAADALTARLEPEARKGKLESMLKEAEAQLAELNEKAEAIPEHVKQAMEKAADKIPATEGSKFPDKVG